MLKMARDGLSFELRNALHKAKATGKPFTKAGISVDEGKKLVSIEVIPLLNTIELHFLIVFTDFEKPAGKEPLTEKDTKAYKSQVADAKDAHIQQLEKDLLQAREDMRGITEDQEAANEELQSANEELLSGNEELQSLSQVFIAEW